MNTQTTPTSLQGHIQQQRKLLEAGKQAIEGKKQQIKALQEEISKCVGRHQIRRKLDLQEQVEQLKKNIETLLQGRNVAEFEEKVKPFLAEQERCREVFRMEDRLGKKVEPVVPKRHSHPSSSSSASHDGGSDMMSFMRKKARTDQMTESGSANRNRVVDDFKMIVQEKAPPIQMQNEDICEHCQSPMLLDMEQSILACSNSACGVGRRYMDATANAVAYGEDVEFAAYSYQRTNYFNEYLTTFQAKETNQVSAKDLEIVMQACIEKRLYNKADITLEKIRDIVRHLRMNRLYKQTTQIWCKITGNRPPRLTAKEEERCRMMFKAIQEPYDRYLPEDRKNFFSYSYCLYKFMELLGYPQYLKHFTLLKDQPKLKKMDVIWKKICDELDWQYSPSPECVG